MNTSQDSRRRVRRVAAALVATALAGAALAVPSAANAGQSSDGGCCSTGARTALPHRATHVFVIDDFVAERKAMMAQDRIDRAWLYL